MIENYDALFQIHALKKLNDYSLSEKQFAQVIGRCRMYQHLPKNLQSNLPQLLFGDTQVNTICKDYYRDDSFCRDNQGDINLWRLYNLFTNTNKSTYIDNFVDKAVNAFEFTEQIRWALENKTQSWFLN